MRRAPRPSPSLARRCSSRPARARSRRGARSGRRRAPGRGRQPAQRPARSRSTRCAPTTSASTATAGPRARASTRSRGRRRRLRAGLHVLAEDARQLRGDHDRPPRLADRLRQEPPAAARLQPDAGRACCKDAGYETVADRRQPERGGLARLRARASTATARRGRRRRSPPRWTARARSPRTGCASCGQARPDQPVLPLAALREPARALRAAAALRHGLPRRRGRRAGRGCGRGRLPRRRPEAVGDAGQARSAGTWRSTTARSPRWTRRSGGCSTPSRPPPVRDRTLVVVTSDHGESLGEHDYYFDHGEDLFDPSLRIPLLVAGPGC